MRLHRVLPFMKASKKTTTNLRSVAHLLRRTVQAAVSVLNGLQPGEQEGADFCSVYCFTASVAPAAPSPRVPPAPSFRLHLNGAYGTLQNSLVGVACAIQGGE